jgi:hypothetical protein
MRCPHCLEEIPDGLIMSAGARLMRAKRKPVDRSFMRAIGAVGGREADKKRRRAQIRKLMEQINERDAKAAKV